MELELDRRDFIKAGACLAGAAAVQPLGLVKAPPVRAESDDVAMLVDVSKCVGCWLCVLACRDCNELPETFVPDHDNPPELNSCVWLTLYTWNDGDRWKYRRMSCMHCTDAACVDVCPTGAVSHNELGFVQFDMEKCSGCGYCVEHCPFGIPQLDSDGVSGIAHMNKCLFCKGRISEGKQPACAEACPTGATTFGNRTELLEAANQRVIELQAKNPQASLYGAEELDGLHVLYVLDESPEQYGLPVEPEKPFSITIRNILGTVGKGVLAVALAGFGLNYLVARRRISQERKQ